MPDGKATRDPQKDDRGRQATARTTAVQDPQSVAQSIERNEQAETPQNNPAQPAQISVKGFKRLLPKDSIQVSAGAAVVTVVVTIVYCVISALQWVAIRNNNEAFLSLQRAFVSVPSMATGTQGALPGAPLAGITIMPNINNSGATRTKNLFVRFNYFYSGPVRMPPGFNFADIPGQEGYGVKFLLGPQAGITGPLWTIPKDKLIQIALGGDHLYVYGRAEYDDIFPGSSRHRTEFCWELAQIGGKFDIVGDPISVTFGLCPSHNCADDECGFHATPNPT